MRDIAAGILLFLLVSTTGLAAGREGAHDPLELTWPATAEQAPDPEKIRALALFPEDEWSRALDCKGSSTTARQVGGARHCTYPYVGTIDLGEVRLLAGAVQESSEWDGMYSNQDEVVLALAAKGAPRVVHILTQWSQSVVDCRTVLMQRRFAVADGGPGGAKLLCVESVKEVGEGLFPVMDLEAAGLPWLPVSSCRELTAWSWEAKSMRLVRQPMLDGKCPQQGYKLFAPTALKAEPGSHLRVRQGPAVEFAQCPLLPSDSCFGIDQCPQFEDGVSSVGGFVHPPVAPWGPPAAVPLEKNMVSKPRFAGLRARVSLEEMPLDAAPVVASGTPVKLRYEKRNVSKEKVLVWHAGFWSNHRILLFRADGDHAKPTKLGQQMLGAFQTDGPREKNVQWPLAPGATDATEGAYDLATLYTMESPGLYLVQVEYRDGLHLLSNVLPVWVLPQEAVNGLKRLNGWHREECDVAERPSQYPGRVSSGETNGFISSAKEALARLGVSVGWDHAAGVYRVIQGPQ